MATVIDLLNSLKQFDLKSAITQSIEETEDAYIELNTQKQLFKGEDSTGSQIQPLYRSSSYAKMKNQMNSAPGYGVPDLKLTGSFYQNMKVRVESDTLILDSDVEYAQNLEKKYDADKIYGLTEDNQEQYNEGPFFNALEQKITEQTGLIFS